MKEIGNFIIINPFLDQKAFDIRRMIRPKDTHYQSPKDLEIDKSIYKLVYADLTNNNDESNNM